MFEHSSVSIISKSIKNISVHILQIKDALNHIFVMMELIDPIQMGGKIKPVSMLEFKILSSYILMTVYPQLIISWQFLIICFIISAP